MSFSPVTSQIDIDRLHAKDFRPPEKNKMASCRLRLSPKAKAFLKFMEAYQAKHGTGPTLEEVRLQFDPARKQGIGATRIVLDRMVHEGVLRFYYKRYRCMA